MAFETLSHHVEVSDRGGMAVFGAIERPSLVRWDRQRDAISEATIRVNHPTPKCLEVLERLRSGRHEIIVHRGDKREWEGPIVRIGYASSYVEVVARDVMHYAYRTIARQGYNNGYPKVAAVTDRMALMMTNEMARKEALDPAINVLPYLDIRTHSGTARTSRVTKAYQTTVWEDIDAMAARSGLDYAVIGRRIFANDVHDIIGRTQTMTQADFQGEIIVTEYGMELATYSAVTDGEGRWGAIGGVDDYYGEWELLNTAYQEEETDGQSAAVQEIPTSELRTQADRNVAGRYPAPVLVRVPDSSLLNPSTTALRFSDLIPGIRIPLRATLTARTVAQEQKLDFVRVEETEAGETVRVTLSPAPGTQPEAWESSGSDA